MAEKHKSKYKAPKDLEKSQKPKPRKDLKSYTHDDKNGGLNPKSTGDKQLNVLRKTDKMMQDDGKYDIKYNTDDRLYDDLENGEWEPKTAAKRLKKRQDAEEKEIADIIKDKVENLTREQRERLVREYVRRKIVKVLLEQDEKKDDTAEETPEAEPTTSTPDATTPPAPDAAATPTPDAAATTTTPAPDATTSPTPDAAATPAPTAPSTEQPAADANAEKQVSPETAEALDVERFVQYLKKQEGNIAKLKSIIKVVNLSLNDAEVEDQANVWKMLKITANKKLSKLGSNTK